MFLQQFVEWLHTILRRETTSTEPQQAQGLVEYALILMFVAIAVILILSLLGPTIGNVFSNVVNQL